MKTFKNTDGFSAIHLLLLLATVGVIGFIGWYVYGVKHDINKSYVNAKGDKIAPNTKKPSVTKSQAQLTKPSNEPVVAAVQNPKVAVPEDCNDFVLDTSGPTSSSLNAVKTGILGEWVGCATTPWVNPYKVDFEFNADGTYSSKALEASNSIPALYYGTDQDNPKKIYSIDTFLGDGKAQGSIVIYFTGSDTTVNNSLDNISLTGNTLNFSFRHLGQYGPLVYKLVRVNQQ